ncbi:permease-like cell division protein FtsX [Mechercharimyces sp. CAU 1602]|uniref:permease-like cell division protein FtsX n=1 Tax=Mechercharimyces sp. CAU 1602 TaxID=2973933 RepID=UPI002162D784|nr:permease-like cell division protein FtsX [Mechercharimyces sp. CAU 1602]MCS1352223.1 permease-like cell division protein FtsX [Mechercharimyces sp. CAU 1602]
MKINVMIRHLKEAIKSLKRNTWMTFAASSAVGVTLLIFGIFLIFSFNILHLAEELDKQMAIRVSLQAGASADAIEDMEKKVEKDPRVNEVTFISKEDGLKELKSKLGADSDFLKGLEDGENPLPDMLKVEPSNSQEIQGLVKDLEEKYNLTESVEYGKGVADQLIKFSTWISVVVFFFGTGLAVLAAFLISNTIKLTVFARRGEIEIMRLVGASNWFIRWPFLIEGAVIGVIGAIVPVSIVLITYAAVIDILDMGTSSFSFLNFLDVWPLALYVASITIMLGAFIGVWGSVMSIRRFLRV